MAHSRKFELDKVTVPGFGTGCVPPISTAEAEAETTAALWVEGTDMMLLAYSAVDSDRSDRLSERSQRESYGLTRPIDRMRSYPSVCVVYAAPQN